MLLVEMFLYKNLIVSVWPPWNTAKLETPNELVDWAGWVSGCITIFLTLRQRNIFLTTLQRFINKKGLICYFLHVKYQWLVYPIVRPMESSEQNPGQGVSWLTWLTGTLVVPRLLRYLVCLPLRGLLCVLDMKISNYHSDE